MNTKQNQPCSLFSRFSSFKVALLFLFLAFSCHGPQGDPGPSGNDGQMGPAGPSGAEGKPASSGYENGFIKGTISGNRRDGVKFEETFEYKLTDRRETFIEPSLMEAGTHNLDLFRFSTLEGKEREENQVNISLSVNKSTQQATLTGFSLDFAKIIADQNLFLFKAFANFLPGQETLLPISRANNAVYHLADFGRIQTFVFDQAAGKSYLTFQDEQGNKIYFSPHVSVADYYSFAFLKTKDGQTQASSLYNDLLVKMTGADEFIFYDAAFASLSERVIVPADQGQVTDFVYDPASGVASFNYKVTIEQLRESNTSRHKAEITGSVQANLFNEIIMRKSFE